MKEVTKIRRWKIKMILILWSVEIGLTHKINYMCVCVKTMYEKLVDQIDLLLSYLSKWKSWLFCVIYENKYFLKKSISHDFSYVIFKKICFLKKSFTLFSILHNKIPTIKKTKTIFSKIIILFLYCIKDSNNKEN